MSILDFVTQLTPLEHFNANVNRILRFVDSMQFHEILVIESSHDL